MVRLLNRHEVHELNEDDTSVHDVHVTEQAPPTVPEEWMREHGTATQERRRPIRWMRWLAFFGLLAVGAGVAVVATLGDSSEVPDGSFEVAEVNRMLALGDLATVPDGSFEVAEVNRMLALGDVATVPDGSFEVAEVNRMLALGDVATG